MNKIEKLIKELCPNGVEWKKLGEICSYTRGITYNKNQETEDDDSYKVLRANNIDVYLNKIVFDDIKKVSSLVKVKKEQFLKSNDILICAGSGSKDHIGKIAFIKNDIDYTFGGFMAVIRPYKEILNRYIFHILASELFKSYLNKSLNSTTINNLNSTIIESFSLPLPPLPIQTEIVRILDKFVEQQEQLERLIELRKKQYEYYREEMLKPKEGEKWTSVRIGDLGTITRGRRFVRDDVRESGMPCIHYGDMYTYYGITARTTKTFLDRNFPKKMQYAKKGDVIVVGAGENDLDIGVGTVWEGNEPAAVHDACYILTHNQNSKYIAYFLRTNNYHQQLRKYVSDGKICSISGVGLGSCLIPIPSLKKQQEIVEFLDKFEFSITALTSALELSKKRYEYYRDEMMRF